jgi:hypothetical protein
MIATALVTKIFATYAGCWAMGYLIGARVAWMKKIASAA